MLIDSGSTNYFLDEETTQELGCALEYTTPMQVSGADGSKIITTLFCLEFTWRIQDQVFPYPVKVIKLGGCNMVLGGDWLRKHNLVEFDYDKMKITMSRNARRSQ